MLCLTIEFGAYYIVVVVIVFNVYLSLVLVLMLQHFFGYFLGYLGLSTIIVLGVFCGSFNIVPNSMWIAY